MAYLWVFSLAGIPIFLALRSEAGQRFLQKIYQFLLHPIKIYLITIPFMLLFWSLDKISPTTNNLIHDWLNLLNSFLLVICGFVLGQTSKFWEMLEINRKWLLGMMVVFGILFYWVVEVGIGLSDEQYFIAKGIITRINGFSIILCIGGYAKHYLNFTNNGLQYANQAVYPFYILHQTITVTIGFYIANLDWAWEIKLLILMAGTFFGSWVIFHFLIRPFNVMRLLFGVKGK